MPAQQPTDRVLLTTKGGSVDFKIVAIPTITGVSNENAAAGDSVYVYGTYLKNIQLLLLAVLQLLRPCLLLMAVLLVLLCLQFHQAGQFLLQLNLALLQQCST